MTDPKELRRLAAAATPGEWAFDPANSMMLYESELTGARTAIVVPEHESIPEGAICEVWGENHNAAANAAFIAAANPQAVTALLDALAGSEAMRDALGEIIDPLQEQAEKAEAERDQLIKAASCIRHWADTHFNKATGETEGMVVSATHVRDLWAVLEALTTPLPAAATFGDNDPGPGPHVDGQSPEWKAAHILPRAPADSVQVRTPGTCHHYIKSGFGGYRCGLGERFHDPADCVIDDCPIRPNQDPSP